MMRSILPVIFFSFIIIAGCAPKVSNSQQSDGYSQTFVDKAYKVLNVPQVKFEDNETADYVLCTYTAASNVPGSQPTQIAVIQKETDKVTYKTSVKNGSVKWIDTYKLELFSPPGMPKGDNTGVKDYTYLIDVRTGKQERKIQLEVKH